MTEGEYCRLLLERITSLANAGLDFHGIVCECEGASPRVVDSIIRKHAITVLYRPSPSIPKTADIWGLPQADRHRSQWWFTPETVKSLVTQIKATPSTNHIICFGCPTVAIELKQKTKIRITLVDIDSEVCAFAKEKGVETITTTASQFLSLPSSEYDLAIADPPWYMPTISHFISAAVYCLKPGGKLHLALLPQFTRPSAISDRSTILHMLLKHNIFIETIQSRRLTYMVPNFESHAFSTIEGFQHLPWRSADLITGRTAEGDPPLQHPSEQEDQGLISVFTQGSRRILLSEHTHAGPGTILATVPNFATDVSRRAITDWPDLWTSENKGLHVESHQHAYEILNCWQAGGNDLFASLVEGLCSDLGRLTAYTVLRKYNEALELWPETMIPPDHLEYREWVAQKINDWIKNSLQITSASQHAASDHPKNPSYMRPHPLKDDTYRGPHARDRDRIVWSGSFRNLANKTQLFPIDSEDHLRQRLAHSIEVLQLSLTIATSLSLDVDLVQAGALSHDIGHTPFGHAGEEALHASLKRITEGKLGFNHYEHGVDVVCWLESPYQAALDSQHLGLNLTTSVCECIHKHTYCHGQKGNSSSSYGNVRLHSKHNQLFPDGYCHKEGQAVRAADKISYLISDIEDGIRVGAIARRDLRRCRLFQYPGAAIVESSDSETLDDFISIRSPIIKLLMEDIINESKIRIRRHGANDPRTATSYLIDYSPAMQQNVKQVWDCLQKGKLHQHPSVIASNLFAAKTIGNLFLLFCHSPELVDKKFRDEHERLNDTDYMNFYKTSTAKTIAVAPVEFSFLRSDLVLGKRVHTLYRIEDIICAKDYVASLTDHQARKLHRQFIGG